MAQTKHPAWKWFAVIPIIPAIFALDLARYAWEEWPRALKDHWDYRPWRH